MKGVTLLEFLVTLTIFLGILLFGYESFDSQKKLVIQMRQRTKPEEESNYRWLVLDGLFRDSSEKLKRDPMLEEAPFFFSDLRFGQEQRNDAFSLARPIGLPLRFQREGSLFHIPPSPVIKLGKMLLLAGVNEDGEFDWNYARVVQVKSTATEQELKLSSLLSKTSLNLGSLIEVEINGFLFKNKMLYWVTSAGQVEPFFGPVDTFQYSWKQPLLTFSWRTGLISAEWITTL